MIEENSRSQVVIWLASGCLLIFLMVLIGGITRLTGSGLSMTDWKLISGAIPPLTDEAWLASFEAYKQFPEYQVRPLGFSLSDYQQIFWWEYIHRALGRLMGVVFILPFLYFLFTKKIGGRFVWKLILVLFLGGLQGFFGWYMVKSGLLSEPHVSHFRLAIHLVTAFVTFTYTFWLILQIAFPEKLKTADKLMGKLSLIFLAFLFLQIIYGAFTAGLKAGLFYNTFPMMDDEWIAQGVTAMQPVYLNFVEGIAGVQFVHRYLGVALFIFSVYYFKKSRLLTSNPMLKQGGVNVLALISIQVLLGIFTLVYALPLSLALMHQVVAFFLLMALVYNFRLSRYTSV